MWLKGSSRYIDAERWAETLRSRALCDREPIDLSDCLEAFRGRDSFYAARLEGISSWHDIPPLEKGGLAGVPVIASEPLHETRSSGTTGCQAVVRNTASERRFRQALAYRPFLFYPIKPVQNNTIRQLIFVDGKEIEAADKAQWPFEFGGRTYLTWRVGIAAAPDRIQTLLQSVRPQVVRGLTSGIVRFVEELRRDLEGCGVQVVSPSGELLSVEWRAALGDAFGAKVLDRYGATETGSMAWQCPYCDGYHINSDELIIEDSDAGVLATPLFIESQPLLRYRLDDRIRFNAGTRDCRVRLPTITVLEARRDDWIIDGEGLKISPLSFQFERIAGLRAWHLHQLKNGELQLYFDGDSAGGELERQLAAQLRDVVGGRSCELVEGVWKCLRGGKFKRVSSDFG